MTAGNEMRPVNTLRHWLLWVGLFLICATAYADLASDALLARLVPQGKVSDFAAVFSSSERGALNRLLKEVHEKTGAEIAVVALKSLEGGEMSDFANRLFENWGIGKKGHDNGVLLIAAIQDRQVRMEVGYGLEGLIPDAKAGRILDQVVLPAFGANQYALGLIQGVQAIAQIIADDVGVTFTGQTPLRRHPKGGKGGRRGFSLLQLLFFLLLIPVIIRHPWLLFFLMSSSGGGFRGGGFGGASGGFGGGLSGGGGAGRSW